MLVTSCFHLSVGYTQIRLHALLLDEKDVPVAYATVYNSSTQLGVITNKEGRFIMDAQPDDVIVIRSLGFIENKSYAGQLQDAGVVVMKQMSYNIDELTVTANIAGSDVDAEAIVRNFFSRIRRNYPRHPVVISGIYKEYTQNGEEYLGYLNCNVDIFINSMSSIFSPTIKTRVRDYKLLRPQNRGRAYMVHETNLRRFWLLGSSFNFLREYKEYKYNYLEHTTHGGSTLIKIMFQPVQINKLKRQFKGILYIDIDSYALVFLHYEEIPNELDYYFARGKWQKLLSREITISFDFKNDFYYHAYIVTKHTMKIKDRDESVDLIFNFFTENIENFSRRNFNSDSLSLFELSNTEITFLEQSMDYKSNFILETEQERLLFQR